MPCGVLLIMTWEVEYTDEFGEWWNGLTEGEQVAIDAGVELLEKHGPTLGYPRSSKINKSRHKHMRELRIQYAGDPYRVLYAFDPRQYAILLIGGGKVGNDRWYEEYVPAADKLYDDHLELLKEEGKENGS